MESTARCIEAGIPSVVSYSPCVTKNEIRQIRMENCGAFSGIWGSAPSWALLHSCAGHTNCLEGKAQTVHTTNIW